MPYGNEQCVNIAKVDSQQVGYDQRNDVYVSAAPRTQLYHKSMKTIYQIQTFVLVRERRMVYPDV